MPNLGQIFGLDIFLECTLPGGEGVGGPAGLLTLVVLATLEVESAVYEAKDTSLKRA